MEAGLCNAGRATDVAKSLGADLIFGGNDAI